MLHLVLNTLLLHHLKLTLFLFQFFIRAYEKIYQLDIYQLDIDQVSKYWKNM